MNVDKICQQCHYGPVRVIKREPCWIHGFDPNDRNRRIPAVRLTHRCGACGHDWIKVYPTGEGEVLPIAK